MNLSDHFVIAMPTLDDPLLSRSVIYICDHNENGAMGIIINKPIFDLTVQMILTQLDISPYKSCAELEHPVFIGGPLSEGLGFILHTPQAGFSSSVTISNTIMVTTSIDVLQSIGSPLQPKELFLSLGRVCWENMQLEYEIAQNDWLVAKAQPDIIFKHAIEDRWHLAAELIGINIETISTQMGQA